MTEYTVTFDEDVAEILAAQAEAKQLPGPADLIEFVVESWAATLKRLVVPPHEAVAELNTRLTDAERLLVGQGTDLAAVKQDVDQLKSNASAPR